MAAAPKAENLGTVSNTRTNADIEGDIQQLREDFATLVQQLSTTKDHGIGAAKRVAADGVNQLRSQSEAAVDNLRANAKDMEAQLIASVREKPMTALATAAGIGFFLALLSRR